MRPFHLLAFGALALPLSAFAADPLGFLGKALSILRRGGP